VKDRDDFITLDTEDWAYVYGAQSVKSFSEPFVIGIIFYVFILMVSMESNQ